MGHIDRGRQREKDKRKQKERRRCRNTYRKKETINKKIEDLNLHLPFVSSTVYSDCTGVEMALTRLRKKHNEDKMTLLNISNNNNVLVRRNFFDHLSSYHTLKSQYTMVSAFTLMTM